MNPPPKRCGQVRSGAVRIGTALRRVALLGTMGLMAGACGGGVISDAPAVGGAGAATQAPALEATSLRPWDGIVAAGGNPAALGGSQPCSAEDAITIAYLGPDLARLDAIGLEELVIEEPSILIDAYVDAVNLAGGVVGRCVRASVHLWDPADPDASYGRICAELPEAEPLVVLNLLGDIEGINCLTIDGDIPTLGLYASAPSEMVAFANGRLFLDDGTHKYLLGNSIEVALRAGHLSADARIGFLRGAGSASEDQAAVTLTLIGPGGLLSLIGRYGIDVNSVASLPAAFGEYSTLLPEKQAGLLHSDLSVTQRAAADEARASMSPATAELLDRIEQFYLDAAIDYRDADVEVVVSTASWFELRRLMRAADLIDWHPWWIASDIQGATLTLTGAPASQVERFVLVSARRAAGDEVPDLDRDCVVLRNAAMSAAPFSHRHHTDAWSVITATCDLLDVAFSALTRASDPLTRETFVAALRQTDYQVAHGGHITFAGDDSSGADRFRVLEADPDCLLNDWGCMRALTGWLAPLVEARDSAE
ncbi:hypothetical protein [Candidatus Poriferisodalis sp.]|uniref:hypothetical protein n=1 Tax=Candidatus Poriferisodalis sp. TaxID=3101277 RepID=UPI003AF7D6E1